MKVLLVIQHYNKRFGGLIPIVTALKNTFKAKIITFQNTFEGQATKEFILIKTKRFLFAQLPTNLYSTLKKEVDENTVLHIHGMWSLNSIFILLFLIRHPNTKVIVSPHGMYVAWSFTKRKLLKTLYFNCIEKHILTRKNSLTHVYQAKEKKELMALGIAENQIRIIGNFTNLQAIDAHIKQADSKPCSIDFSTSIKQYCFIGRLHPVKGLRLLIHSWYKVFKNDDTVQLNIFGSNDGEQDYIDAFITKHQITNIKLWGFVDAPEKFYIMNHCHYFVQTSFTEGFSMSILEALACSLPAIITDTCNFEAVQHYNAGIVCKTTEDSISKALERAKNIAESDHAKQRIQARTLVKENFEESLILDQYKTLYT